MRVCIYITMWSKMYSPTNFYIGVWLCVGGASMLLFALELGKYISVHDKKK